MPKYIVVVSERLMHTFEVEAENREAIADMVGDMQDPIKTEIMAYEYLPEFTEDIILVDSEFIDCKACFKVHAVSDGCEAG